MGPCSQCPAPAVVTVNDIPACEAHLDKVMQLAGMPASLIATLLRERAAEG